MLSACGAPSELRQSTAISWRHSGQRYTRQVTLASITQGNSIEAKQGAHSLISLDAFGKTRSCSAESGEAIRLAGRLISRIASEACPDAADNAVHDAPCNIGQ
jgi:hypothetical protein